MQKKRLLCFLILFLSINLISGIQITGGSLEKDIKLKINVLEPLPVIEIISPKNGTYLSNNINLIAEATNTKEVLASVDMHKNFSLNGLTTINLNEGFHTIDFYAIGKYHIIKKSATFNINLSKFKINYNDYLSPNSTNFYLYPFEDYFSFRNISLKINHGKIYFKNPINLIQDKDPNDNLLDLDKNIKIYQNYISVNATELPNFNQDFQIELYNLDFKNPIIMKNHHICQKNECELISYKNGIAIFNVQEAGIYSLKEGEIKEIPPTQQPPVKSSKNKIDKSEIVKVKY